MNRYQDKEEVKYKIYDTSQGGGQKGLKRTRKGLEYVLISLHVWWIMCLPSIYPPIYLSIIQLFSTTYSLVGLQGERGGSTQSKATQKRQIGDKNNRNRREANKTKTWQQWLSDHDGESRFQSTEMQQSSWLQCYSQLPSYLTDYGGVHPGDSIIFAGDDVVYICFHTNSIQQLCSEMAAGAGGSAAGALSHKPQPKITPPWVKGQSNREPCNCCMNAGPCSISAMSFMVNDSNLRKRGGMWRPLCSTVSKWSFMERPLA